MICESNELDFSPCFFQSLRGVILGLGFSFVKSVRSCSLITDLRVDDLIRRVFVKILCVRVVCEFLVIQRLFFCCLKHLIYQI
ncbi:hypothetical protein Hanom_Chr07g00663531 [Helianthus anomalus]